MAQNGLIQYKIIELKKDIDALKNDVELILTNHLPHIKEDIISLKTRVTLATAANIGAITLGVIATKLFQ